jgi:hypothetical protein
MQDLLVIIIVAASACWLAWQVYRYVHPKGGKVACAGGCCDGKAAEKPAATRAGGTQMISSDDLRARLQARQR